MLWPYRTPGIPDDLFESLPGIPLTKREGRLLLLSALRMPPQGTFWDIGAGTGTIPIEIGLLCPEAAIVAVERDEDVAKLIRRNCQRFGVQNVTVFEGIAPDCFAYLPPKPDRICIEGGQDMKAVLQSVWEHLAPGGRVVTIATNLENLYRLSEGLAECQARNIEVVQSAVNRLETKGIRQVFAAIDPMFILSGEKIT
jgi:cobalt-precorrin-6B (C15)-methyltransferase